MVLIFHSISAYNNAGFLYGQIVFKTIEQIFVNSVFVFLIVMGGLGWRVIDDIWSNKKIFHIKISLHSRLVIRQVCL